MLFIQDGPPPIDAIKHTDNPGIEARSLCTVDGFPAELHHIIDTKRQEHNRHELSVYYPAKGNWILLMYWGFVEAGHVPTYPEDETLAYLRGLSEAMWHQANVIAHQARLRQEELDVAQYVAKRIEFDHELTALINAREAAQAGIDILKVDNGEIAFSRTDNVEVLSFGPAADTIIERVNAEDVPDEAPYTGTEPEDQG